MSTPDVDRLKKLAGIIPLYEDVNPYEDAPLQEDPKWWETLVAPIVDEWIVDIVDHNPDGSPNSDEERNSFILNRSDDILTYVFDKLYTEKGITEDVIEDYEEVIVKAVDAVIVDITGAIFENRKITLEDVNPYEDTNERWWWDDESNDGVSWWNIEDLLEKVSGKVVGPDYGVYAKIWYNILSHYADEIWNNTDDDDFDDETMMDNVRQNLVANVGVEDWNQFIEQEIKYYIPEYKVLSSNPSALVNFKKIGELTKNALESKEKPSLKEDVNPYEDNNIDDFEELLLRYIRICAKYKPVADGMNPEFKEMSLPEYTLNFMKSELTDEEMQELFGQFTDEEVLEALKQLI